MTKGLKFWKITGIYLVILNFILLIIFSGFVIDRKILQSESNSSLFEIDYNNLNNYDLKEDDVIIGNENASLTMIIYNDYESPFCKKFDKHSYELLKEEFVDTGKVKLVIRDYPMPEVHKNSLVAAQAVKCAEEQEMGEEMHEIILDNKNPNETNLKIWAGNLDLDNKSFCNCLDSDKYLEDIALDVEEAEENDIRVVPTFFIGDEKLEGVQPYFVMKKAIETELEKLE